MMGPSYFVVLAVICSCAYVGASTKKYIYISKKTEDGITWHGFSSNKFPSNGYKQITGLNADNGDISYFGGFSHPEVVRGCNFSVPLHIMRAHTKTPRSRRRQLFTILKQGKPFTGFHIVDTVYVARDGNDCSRLPGVRAIHYRACAKIIIKDDHEAMYATVGTVQQGCGSHYPHRAAIDTVYAYTGKLFCPDLPLFHHGVRTPVTDGDVRVKQYNFQCNNGYGLHGRAHTYCSDHGRWNPQYQPQCLLDCGKPEILENGETSLVQGTAIGSTAKFKCSLGFGLQGSSTASCRAGLSHADWDYGYQGRPSCEALDCGKPDTSENGEVLPMQNTTYGSTAYFQCRPGFRLQGSTIAVCKAKSYDVYWDFGQLGKPTCEEIRCPKLQFPSHGRYLQISLSLGSKRTLLCDSGYKMSSGNITRICEQHGNEGRWSGEPQACALITCPTPTAPQNGKVLGTATTYESEVRYECDEGYRLQGADKSTCLADGWQPEVPKCKARQCPDPGVPMNGHRSGDSLLAGAVVTFTCKHGYELDGEDSSTCGKNGHWSSSLPECTPVECRHLLAPRFGSRDGEQVTFGSTVQFSCFGGYHLEGQAETSCQANKTWSHSVPTCKACQVGTYRLSGSSNKCRKCPANSMTLTEASPSVESCTCVEGTSGPPGGPCIVIKCEALTSPAHGSLSAECQTALYSECEVTCDLGYVLTAGTAYRKCTSDGWTGSEAKCSACPENTYTMHAGATSCIPCPKNMIKDPGQPGPCRCAPGFVKLPGGRCIDINECSITNGGCNQTCVNSVGSYSCKCHIPGYALEADGKGCTLNQSCPNLDQKPSNGNFSCKYTKDSNGHICHIICKKGYFFVSGINDYVTCGLESMFEWSHRLVNKTARVPGCTREFFVDIELPIRLRYLQSCNSSAIDVKAIATHLQQALNGISGLERGINDVKVSCSSYQAEAEVTFDVRLKNPNSHEVPLDCESDCQRNNMRSLVQHTVQFKSKVRAEVTFQLPVLGSPSTITIGKPRMICKEGRVFTKNRLCVPCDRGYYLPRRDLEACRACPKGTFQEELGQAECKACLPGSTTLSKGSDHPSMCSQREQILNAPDDTL